MKHRIPSKLALGAFVIVGLFPSSPIAAAAQASTRTASSFKAVDIEAEPVSFPSDFKGRVVMLDFWATWCPPCVAEVPGIVAVYNKYHDKGFDILGVSLDQANGLDRVRGFMKKYGMTWRQIYDGKFWQARIARFYGIDSIPRAFLVDGDTGAILASGDSLRGESLEPVLAAALAGKKK
ncbi:MAG: TlpA disulfide reductase family protein [Rectinemataceae bacterium]|jgi:thiol-disulfide isomerase/thioredoxin